MAGAMVLKTMTFGLSGFDSHLLRSKKKPWGGFHGV